MAAKRKAVKRKDTSTLLLQAREKLREWSRRERNYRNAEELVRKSYEAMVGSRKAERNAQQLLEIEQARTRRLEERIAAILARLGVNHESKLPRLTAPKPRVVIRPIPRIPDNYVWDGVNFVKPKKGVKSAKSAQGIHGAKAKAVPRGAARSAAKDEVPARRRKGLSRAVVRALGRRKA